MRRIPLLATVIALALTSTTLLASAAAAQTDGFPTISARTYTGGSAKVTVTGSTKITSEIPINTQASISDGESTWLQFGASGSADPNALITYGETKETGITIGEGKFIVTGGILNGEKPECSGKVSVTATLISGDYACTGLVSKQPSGGMGKVDIKVTFTAKS
jgi:hypothetical protein